MTKKTLNIRFRTLDELRKDLKEASVNFKPYIQRKEDIFYDTPKNFCKNFSINQITILVAIKKFSPDSLEDLASKTSFSLREVQKICFDLSFSGFLKETKIDFHDISLPNFVKEFKKPELSFPYDTIEVHAPSGLNWSYKI